MPGARCYVLSPSCHVQGAIYKVTGAMCLVLSIAYFLPVVKCQVFLVPLSACDARCPRRGKYLIRESIHRRARVHGREIAASSTSTPMWSVRLKNSCKCHYLLLLLSKFPELLSLLTCCTFQAKLCFAQRCSSSFITNFLALPCLHQPYYIS